VQAFETWRLWGTCGSANPATAGPAAALAHSPHVALRTSVYPATPGYQNAIKPANVRCKGICLSSKAGRMDLTDVMPLLQTCLDAALALPQPMSDDYR